MVSRLRNAYKTVAILVLSFFLHPIIVSQNDIVTAFRCNKSKSNTVAGK